MPDEALEALIVARLELAQSESHARALQADEVIEGPDPSFWAASAWDEDEG